MTDQTKASEEQVIYANILNIIGWIGWGMVIVTFIIYTSGILPPFIPIEKVSLYWGMNVNDYIHTVNAPRGWGWITLLAKGDYMNFIGIAILAILTIICYLSILPILIKKKDILYVVIVILQVCILVLTASGILLEG